MNPMTNVKNIIKLSEQELRVGGKTSWHDQYKDSAWIFIGGLPYGLTEGDVICVFSQYGEIVNINLVRDKESGKQKGFCFICYEDQKSTILAVDNLNGIKILGRTIRVDHVNDYKAPKDSKKNPIDDETRLLREEGCAPLTAISRNAASAAEPTKSESFKQEDQSGVVVGGVRLPPRLPIRSTENVMKESTKKVKKEKSKKSRKERKKKKRKRSSSSSSRSSSDSSDSSESSDSDRRLKKKKKKK